MPHLYVDITRRQLFDGTFTLMFKSVFVCFSDSVFVKKTPVASKIMSHYAADKHLRVCLKKFVSTASKCTNSFNDFFEICIFNIPMQKFAILQHCHVATLTPIIISLTYVANSL